MMIIEAQGRDDGRGGVGWLLLIVGLAFLARAVALWWARPEFMGWFNHAPWYWVQTRGLLQDGELPFADLPVLFHLYAGVAAALTSLGLELPDAIMTAQRAVMCGVAALLAWPCWIVVRGIHGETPLGWAGWLLVGAAAVMPLTFAHLPELLQKNMLGLLLLACLLAVSYAALERPAWGIAGLLLFLFIALTHLGSLAAAGLWIVALVVALAVGRDRTGLLLGAMAVSAAALLLGIAALNHFDPGAWDRVSRFVLDGWRHSVLGLVLEPAPLARRGLLLGVVLAVAALLWAGFRTWRDFRGGLTPRDRVFWLANLLFIGLLLLPLFDVEVAVRLILFLPLPVLFLLAFYRAHGRRPRLANALVVAATAGSLVLVVGEVANLVRPLPDKAAVQAQLAALDERDLVSGEDLVVAPYAVAPVANWFLGARTTLVTSVQRTDFDDYRRVFVLNSGYELPTRPGDMDPVTTPADRYRAMRRAVPLPAGLAPDPAYDAFRWYELREIPSNWRFDESGHWVGADE